MSILERLSANAADLGVFAAVAVFITTIKWVMSPVRESLRNLFINTIVSVPVGVLAGGLAMELGYQAFGAMTTTATVTFLAREVLAGIQKEKTVQVIIEKGTENLVDKFTK